MTNAQKERIREQVQTLLGTQFDWQMVIEATPGLSKPEIKWALAHLDWKVVRV